MTRNPLRDNLAHSYRDELPEPYEWEPYEFRWSHIVGFLVGIGLIYGAFVSLVILGTALS
jgi:hypothetical protein